MISRRTPFLHWLSASRERHARVFERSAWLLETGSLVVLGAALLLLGGAAGAQETGTGGVESDAETEIVEPIEDEVLPSLFPPPPIGVRFAEPIEGAEVRVQYSWERIQSQGLVSGTRDVTPDHARTVSGFTKTPRSLEVTVHNFQVAYAPHPRVTLVAELPFIQKELETVDPTTGAFQNQTEGVGDVVFGAVVPFIRKGSESSHVYIAIDAPTGAFRRGGDDTRLPYDSQIGNGSWDFEWGWTYRGGYQRVSWGAQGSGRHPLHRNSLNYREGSRFVGTLWGAARVIGGLSTSLRGEWVKTNNISGFDRSMMARVDPSQNDKTRGGERLSLAPGLSLDVPLIKGGRVAIEFGIPVYQRLDGPQLERDWNLKMGWQWVY